MTLRRWLKSTSNRTFIVWPLALFLVEALVQQDVPRFNPWALPLLAWGYLQYRWVGTMRTREGGGGPGISVPPERIVTDGAYRWVRNPMYLGHLIFFAGLALVLQSWIGAAVLAFHVVWFDARGARGRAPSRGALRRAVPRIPPPLEALDSRRPVSAANALLGDAFALASASCFALSNIAISRGARAGSGDNGAFVSLLLTTLIAGAGWIAMGAARGFEPVTARALLWFAGAGVFTAFIGRVFFYASVQHLARCAPRQ
jgi:hypothetical protein